MKASTLTFLALISFVMILGYGCDKEDEKEELDCISALASNQIEEIESQYIMAELTYNSNPTDENCQDYKDALADYYGEIINLKDCYVEVGLEEGYDILVAQLEDQQDDLC